MEKKSLKNNLNLMIKLSATGLMVLTLLFMMNFVFTGDVALNLNPHYVEGETLKGNFTLNVQEGELIPLDSQVIVLSGGGELIFSLSDFVDSGVIEGTYYAKNLELNGSGLGYGLVGLKTIYPEVDFVLREIEADEEIEVENETEIEEDSNESISGENSSEEITSESSEETTEEETTDSTESVESSEGSDEESSSESTESTGEEESDEESSSESTESTGEEESEDSSSESVESSSESSEDSSSESSESSSDSSDSSTESSDSSSSSSESSSSNGGNSGSSSESSSESSSSNGGNSGSSSESSSDSSSSDGGAAITGEAIEGELIFGSVSKGNEWTYFLDEGESVKIVDSDEEIELEVEEGEAKVTTDYEEVVYGFGKEFLGDKEMVLKINFNEMNITAKKGLLIVKVVHGNTEIISSSQEIGILKAELNESNVSVETIQYGAVLGQPVKWKKKVKVLDENDGRKKVVVEIPKEATNVNVMKGENTSDGVKITGMVSAEIDAGDSWIKKLFKSITGRVVDEGIEETKDVVVEDNASYLEIEYETPAPVAIEENTSYGKEIVISSDYHYEDILAFTELPREVPVGEAKLYWIVNGSRELVNVDEYDTNENDLVDFIEWVVPHLSNQTYQLVIEISQAEHLDSNRSFIEDVYDEVSVDDDVYALISDGEYLRVRFEQELDSSRDITFYGRANESSFVEVMAKDSDEVLINFTNVLEDKMYKMYLDNLVGLEDEFDLRVGGAVEFDLVIDPEVSGCVNITSPGTYTLTGDITDAADLACINITSDDVIFDCQGHTIDGSDHHGYGVYATGITNITVKNCTLTEWGVLSAGSEGGISLNDVNYSFIQDINASYNDNGGIYMSNTNHNLIERTTTTYNSQGVVLAFSSINNSLTNCTANNNAEGFFMQGDYNNLTNCIANYNGEDGFNSDDSNYNTFVNCSADNNTDEGFGSGSDGYFDNSNFTNCSADNNSGDGFETGSNNTFTNCTADNNARSGFNIYSSNILTNCTAKYNNLDNTYPGAGIHINDDKNYNRIIGCDIIGNGNAGITCRGANYNLFHNNLVSGSATYGIDLWGHSDYNNITNNIFIGRGITDSGLGNRVINNTIKNTNVAFHLVSDASPFIVNNTLISNSPLILINSNTADNLTMYNNFIYGSNIFLAGYLPVEENTITFFNSSVQGNYWAGDATLGFSRICVDNNTDGVCDSPYDIENDRACVAGVNCSNNTDYLPLSTHALAGEFTSPLLTTLSPTESINITQNESYLMQFNVTCVEKDCGKVSVYLDPITSICDVANSDCSDCSSLFDDSTSGWVYDATSVPGVPLCRDSAISYLTTTSANCDYYNVGGSDSDCALYSEDANANLYICPSYDRLGSAVSDTDCDCYAYGNPTPGAGDCSGWASIDDSFEFTSEFFAGSSGVTKGGLVNTTEGATPFWTNASSNPQNFTMNQGDSVIVNFSVNATGTPAGPYTFYAYAQDTNSYNIVLTNTTDTWTVNISDATSDSTAPQVTINAPVNGTTYTASNTTFNVSTNEASSCNYSVDAGVTNTSINSTDVSLNTTFVGYETLANAVYTANFYCEDGSSNMNDTESVIFTVSTSSSSTSSSSSSSSSGGGGGGSSSSSSASIPFEVTPEHYENSYLVGTLKLLEIKIENKLLRSEDFSIEVSGDLKNYLIPKEEVVTINGKETKTTGLELHVPDEVGVYVGKIKVTYAGASQYVEVAINAEPETSLFDVLIDIPFTKKRLDLGENLSATISLTQLGIKESLDAVITYTISDFDGNVLLEVKDIERIYDEKKIEKEFDTSNLEMANYILAVEVKHPNGIAVASSRFSVEDKIIETTGLLFILIFLLIGLVIFLGGIIKSGGFKKFFKEDILGKREDRYY